MSVEIFSEGKPRDFEDFTALPKTKEQEQSWQNLNRSWWESNPMRYDFTESLSYPEFSKEFYQEIDRRFFSSVWAFMPWKKIPFDNLVDFEALGSRDVLEIGVGCGSHAQLLSSASRSYTGIDLTEYAVNCTQKRLNAFGCRGTVRRMDATAMDFPDASFDLVWSWGVIHHSADTKKILSQINRVLRPGGKALIMVYHDSVWNAYVRGALYYGILKGGFLKGKSINTLIQESTDGALARYYGVSEWANFVSDFFSVEKSYVFGSKSQLIPLPYGKTKEFFMSLIPNALGRWITNRPFFGFLLVTALEKQ